MVFNDVRSDINVAYYMFYLVTRSVIARVSELFVHRYRTARAPLPARSRSSIKMAERPMEPQAFTFHFTKKRHLKKKKKKKEEKKMPLKTVFVLSR